MLSKARASVGVSQRSEGQRDATNGSSAHTVATRSAIVPNQSASVAWIAAFASRETQSTDR